MAEQNDARMGNDGVENESAESTQSNEQKAQNDDRKFIKDTARQLKKLRETVAELENRLSDGQEGKRSQAPDGAGLTGEELRAAIRFERIVGGFPEDVQSRLDEMPGSFSEKLKFAELAQSLIKKQASSKESDNEKDRMVKKSNETKQISDGPSTVAANGVTKVFKTIADFRNASRAEREEWLKSGNDTKRLGNDYKFKPFVPGSKRAS